MADEKTLPMNGVTQTAPFRRERVGVLSLISTDDDDNRNFGPFDPPWPRIGCVADEHRFQTAGRNCGEQRQLRRAGGGGAFDRPGNGITLVQDNHADNSAAENRWQIRRADGRGGVHSVPSIPSPPARHTGRRFYFRMKMPTANAISARRGKQEAQVMLRPWRGRRRPQTCWNAARTTDLRPMPVPSPTGKERAARTADTPARHRAWPWSPASRRARGTRFPQDGPKPRPEKATCLRPKPHEPPCAQRRAVEAVYVSRAMPANNGRDRVPNYSFSGAFGSFLGRPLFLLGSPRCSRPLAISARIVRSSSVPRSSISIAFACAGVIS